MTSWFRTLGAAIALIFAPLLPAQASAETLGGIETFYVEGEGAVPLAVTMTGPEDAPEILLIHGLGMGTQSFTPQFQSDLAKHFRLVAFDLRGHAMSGKPSNTEAYTNTAVWADDVARVIKAAKLKKPVLVGWSYGTLVAADYLREHGSEDISGLVMVGALGGFIPFTPSAEAPDPELLAQLGRLQELRKSSAFDDQLEAVEIFLPMLAERETPPGWIDTARILGMMVPAYVNGPLRQHPSDNTDLVPLLQEMPVLVLHGEHDPSVAPAALAAFSKVAPEALLFGFADAGHSPFAEDAEAFNRALAYFVNENWNRTAE